MNNRIEADIFPLNFQHELLATAGNKNSGDELGVENRRLRNEKQAIEAEEASRQDMKTRIDELIAFLKDNSLR